MFDHLVKDATVGSDLLRHPGKSRCIIVDDAGVNANGQRFNAGMAGEIAVVQHLAVHTGVSREWHEDKAVWDVFFAPQQGLQEVRSHRKGNTFASVFG